MVQEPVHAVQNPTVETLPNVADLAVSHSGQVGAVALAPQYITLLFLQACLPVTAELLLQVLKLITVGQNGQAWDFINSAKVSMP
jgi:hypothetical protein